MSFPQRTQASHSTSAGHLDSEKAPSAHVEPLAVIGLACRFPQNATNVESLWQCLLAGRSMATRTPKEKINTEGYYHPDPERGGSIYSDVGHFLADSTAPFDAPFFNLSKNDILSMDPQQRLILENTYQALENGL
jgi:acyl transferase domain-containing protein